MKKLVLMTFLTITGSPVFAGTLEDCQKIMRRPLVEQATMGVYQSDIDKIHEKINKDADAMVSANPINADRSTALFLAHRTHLGDLERAQFDLQTIQSTLYKNKIRSKRTNQFIELSTAENRLILDACAKLKEAYK